MTDAQYQDALLKVSAELNVDAHQLFVTLMQRAGCSRDKARNMLLEATLREFDRFWPAEDPS